MRIVLWVAFLPLLSCSALSVRPHQGGRSPNFDGYSFHNQHRVRQKNFGDIIHWMWTRERTPWSTVQSPHIGKAPPKKIHGGKARITFINHATTLIQIAGINILTDPIYSYRPSPISWLGPARVRPPGIRFQDLPPIHVVIISHNHYDHMDIPTLKRLYERDRSLVVAGLGNAHFLKSRGIDSAVEIDWWNKLPIHPNLSIHGVPAQHWSIRGLTDRNASLWLGYVLRSNAGTVYFAGDTGLGPHFAQIRKKFGPVDIALLPIGAYKPRWFMKDMHMGPADALKAHRLLGARRSIAIHFGTFPLADDGQYEAPRELHQRIARTRPANPFHVFSFGESRNFPLGT